MNVEFNAANEFELVVFFFLSDQYMEDVVTATRALERVGKYYPDWAPTSSDIFIADMYSELLGRGAPLVEPNLDGKTIEEFFGA